MLLTLDLSCRDLFEGVGHGTNLILALPEVGLTRLEASMWFFQARP